jgi:hypothetical protein
MPRSSSARRVRHGEKVAPGGHIGLFMARSTFAEIWPELVTDHGTAKG